MPRRRSSPPIKSPWLRRITQLVCALTVVLLLAAIYTGIQFNNLVKDKFEGQMWQLPNVVYARPLILSPDSPVSQQIVLKELAELHYRQVANPVSSGEYSVSGRTVRLIRRPFVFPDGEQPAVQVKIRFAGQGVASMSDEASGHPIGLLSLEPRILGMLDDDNTEKRLYMAKDDMPETLVAALLATEDRDFYQHDGISPLAIARAFMANISAGHNVQGGSTLTQQLAKNLFLSRERSLTRKVKEAYLALIMDYRYSKDQLLDAYLNQVYLGQNGNDSIHGFALAARHYFALPLSELRLDQQALLVGMVKGPSYYNPWRYPERAKARRNLVLKMMVETGSLETDDYQRAIDKPLSLRAQGNENALQPAYFDYVKQSLQEHGIDYNSGRGLRLFTTFDPDIQQHAEQSVYNIMPQLEKKTGQSLETAMIIADKHSGAVSAMIGSRNPTYHGFNRALHAERQIGSLIKPAVYLTALSQPQVYTLATPLSDRPISIRSENDELWSPRNYDRQYRGQVALYQALAHSYNVPTVNLGMALGLGQVTQTLSALGIDSQQVPQLPSMLLGAVTLTPLEVTQMYQTLGNQGKRQTLYALSAVLDEHGSVLYRYQPDGEQTVDERAAWLTEYAMTQVVEQGTARYLKNIVPSRTQLAGKTGTSDQGRDSWYAGIDDSQVVTVWVGRDDNQAVNLTGSSGPLRIYADFLKRNGYRSLDTPQPDQIEFADYRSDANGFLQRSCLGQINLPVWNISGESQDDCLTPLEDGLNDLGNEINEAGRQIGGFLRSLFN
ncbi:penicillin-binding protein 1B [Methylophaga sp.]|uniref:penicillin-binding protein 1B n=1 Tax=Methylophaga sp. TaxID=2024840 RepID=UPI003A9017C7